MKVAILLVLALAALQGATCHTYHQAKMVGVKDNANATATLEYMTHSGIAYYVLNVTEVKGLSAARLVYGNASLYAENVISYIELEEPVSGTYSWEGEFQAGNFTAEYPWSMATLSANAGLGHIWAVLSNNASYGNTILMGQLLIKSGAELAAGAELAERADMATGYM